MTPAPREPEEIGGGTNSRALNDTLATTGPGLPDEALAEGETLEDELVNPSPERGRTEPAHRSSQSERRSARENGVTDVDDVEPRR